MERSEKKVMKVTKSQIIDLINQGVTKDKGSPYYRKEVGTLMEKLNCKQSAIVGLFKNNRDLQNHYLKTFKTDNRVESFELED